MQIPIQKINKAIIKLLPYFVILILLVFLFFQRENYKDEIEYYDKELKSILSENNNLYKENEKLTSLIDKSLSEREKIIEKYYHTKEVINQLESDYENTPIITIYNDSIPIYITGRKFKPYRRTAD